MKKRFALVAGLVFLLMTMVPMTVLAQWQTTEGKTYYYVDGQKVTGFQKIGKYTYYFDSDGVRVYGWQTITVSGIKQQFYFSSKKGRMSTGLKKIGKNYYLFSSTGIMLKGLQTYGGKTYYAKVNGVVVRSAWVTVSAGDQRYFGSDGAMVTNAWIDGKQVGTDGKLTGAVSRSGWITEGGSTYYYVSNVKQTGFQTISGEKYYFNSSGVMQTGWFTVGGYTYYASAKGVLQVSKWKDNKYLTSTGAMATGWATIGTTRYYFNADGTTPSGWKTINSVIYYFDKGVMKTHTWIKENGTNTWYVKKDGSRASGFLKISGKYYYFNPTTGRVTKGFFTVDGKIYYGGSKKGVITRGKTFTVGKYTYTATSSGALLTGLQSINGNLYYYKPKNGRMSIKKKVTVNGVTYYFDKNGIAVKNKWVKVNGNYYYFGSDGKMAVSTTIDNYYIDASGVRGSKVSTYTGWKTINNSKYYYEDGEMVTGWKTISGSKYYFKKKTGAMVTGLQTIGGKNYYFYPTGIVATSTTLVVSDKQYTINASGVIVAEEDVDVSGDSVGSQIAKFAIQYVGNKYVYGGTSLTDGADCSGFVQTVFRHFGIILLRVADDQWKGPGSALIASGYKRAVTVSASDLLPGDLVFYGSSTYATHVGIYIGDGKIVHASNSQAYPAGGIKISNMNYATPVGYVRYWS